MATRIGSAATGKLAGRTCLVTGSSRGIGLAVARAYSDRVRA